MRPGSVMAAMTISVLVGACGGYPSPHSPGSRQAGPEAANPKASAPAAAPRNRSFTASSGSDLPVSCKEVPQLPPTSPTPTRPVGSDILGDVESALSAQYPTVYGGIRAGPATPGAGEVTAPYIVFETVHDRALESEAESAFQLPLGVTFKLAPRSWACLQDIQASIGSVLSDQPSTAAPVAAGSTVYSWGIAVPNVFVGTTACTPQAVQALSEWFSARWGDAVQLQTCGRVPSAVG
jgi:hypothetical protein